MAWSTKKKRGRPKVVRTPHDYGNERVQARVELFRKFRGDSAIGHEMSCAGRLMIVGAFDGMETDPETALSALLAYQHAYWGNYPSGPRVAAYERQDRSHDNTWDDKRGEWFDAQDGRLRDCGHQVRIAVHSVTVDRHWFPDEDVAWASRVIESRIHSDRTMAFDSDWAMLDLLRTGAMALAGDTKMRRAA